MTYPTSVMALFCEDMREEVGGKTTLVGILPENLNVPELPSEESGSIGAMPQLCIYLRLGFDVQTEISSISVHLTFPDDTVRDLDIVNIVFVKKAQEEAKAKGRTMAGIISQVRFAPFPLPKFGRLQVATAINSVQYLSVLNFSQNESSTKLKKESSGWNTINLDRK